jgi:hypothetical protein
LRANPYEKKEFAHLFLATMEDIHGYQMVCSQIGEDNIHDFECWAFGAQFLGRPIKYDEAARFLWNNRHWQRMLTCPLKEAIQKMIDYWNEKEAP